MTQEIRSLATDLQVVTRDDNGSTVKQIQGYAIMFNVPSVDLGGFTEVIQPTALANVDLSDVALVYAHQNNSILARVSAGNLTLTVDDTGLFFSAILPDTTLANDVYTDISVGNVKGMSFSFSVDQDEWSQNQDGTLLHTVIAIDQIPEITITAYPAYVQTSVELQRSYKEQTQLHERDNSMAEDKTATTPATDAPAPAPTDDQKPAANVDVQAINAQLTALTAQVTKLQEQLEAATDPDEDGTADAPNASDETDSTRDDGDAPELPDTQAASVRSEPQDTELETRDAAHKGAKDMPQIVNKETLSDEQVAIRSYIDALKDVNKRDGVTVNSEGAILVPKQILDIQKTPEDPTVLAAQINKVTVSNPSGTLPVLAKTSARLVTKEELAKNPEVAKAAITSVPFAVKTYIGQLPISQEMIQDYAEAETLVSSYLSQVKAATEEEAIGAVISTKFGSNVAKTLDDIKSAYNKLVNYGANRVIVLSVSAFNAIDQLKDGEGRYYIQSNVTAASGNTLFGAPVVIVADTTLGKDGDANLFVGSLKHAIIEANRLDGLATSWVQNDYFEQVLSVAARFDIEVADAAAGKFFNFAPVAAPAK
ncbi:phage major capsid protein [Leuconostoc citreum]|uniref:phage major capsid protein n=1 Tax=Leuconostoc citreum TaxID=33964 RepID=UPI001C1F6C96|nr:phage major capsid protein [Leuconostoc citreum]MBU7451552.1 phage major capsid protein [Leuconostoc citreum]